MCRLMNRSCQRSQNKLKKIQRRKKSKKSKNQKKVAMGKTNPKSIWSSRQSMKLTQRNKNDHNELSNQAMKTTKPRANISKASSIHATVSSGSKPSMQLRMNWKQRLNLKLFLKTSVSSTCPQRSLGAE